MRDSLSNIWHGSNGSASLFTPSRVPVSPAEITETHFLLSVECRDSDNASTAVYCLLKQSRCVESLG